MAAAAMPAASQAVGSIAGAAAGGPATSGSDARQDSTSSFSTGAKTVNFGPPPSKNSALQNPFVIGGLLLAVALVAIVWLKTKK